MPALKLTSLDGKTWTAAEFRGRTVLVEFWATWCAPCREIAPEIYAFYGRHKNRVTILSVSLDENGGLFKSFTQDHPFPNPVAHGGPRLAKPWGITQMPALVLVRDGRVLSKWQGKDAVRDALTSLGRELQ